MKHISFAYLTIFFIIYAWELMPALLHLTLASQPWHQNCWIATLNWLPWKTNGDRHRCKCLPNFVSSIIFTNLIFPVQKSCSLDCFFFFFLIFFFLLFLSYQADFFLKIYLENRGKIVIFRVSG